MSLGPECRYKREDCFAEVRIYGGVENAKNSERK